MNNLKISPRQEVLELASKIAPRIAGALFARRDFNSSTQIADESVDIAFKILDRIEARLRDRKKGE